MSSKEESQLDRNMRLAARVAMAIRLQVPNSGNYDFTSSRIRIVKSGARGSSGSGPGGAAAGEGKGDFKGGERKVESKEPSMQLLGPYIHRGKPKDVEKLRVKMKKEFGDFQTNQSWLDSVQVVTKYCTAAGLGNCGELASMACGQLHALGVRNVDYVQISTVQIDTRLVQGNPVLPHCICVLGRTLGRTDDSAYIGLPNEWGPDAVVCDPWDRVVYPASRYMEFWTGIVEAAKGGALTCQLLHRFT